ncbi:hypothetical protein [Salinarimonas chemoclinalis]|uniref:hypothetical protein n=1 Tax=Salinarimonas chemoclinalis TaxID=3241599 RepID=UPI0035578186
MSKKGFAELIGVSQGRVSQMVKAGLPVLPNGRINVAAGRAWCEENTDPNRRRANLAGAPGQPDMSGLVRLPAGSARAARDAAEADIARMKAERMRGRLLDRRTTLRTVESYARAERDSWLGFVHRVAPLLAAETGAEISAVAAILDREIRDHLANLAANPVELPS